MRFLLAAAGLLGLTEAIPSHQSLQLRDAQSEPCGIAARQLSLSRSGQIPTNVALSCLRSVPLDAEGGTKQLLGLKTVLQFQSTLEFTKDPPSGWVRPATDLIGGLDTLQHRLNASVYTNEYDFQFDLYRLVNSAYDFHLVYTPDIVNIFSFGFGTALYSLSQDGLSLPEVYYGRKDALASSAANSSAVSPLVKIDDRDVQTALNEFAINNTQFQDLDAGYNAVFYVVPLGSPGYWAGALAPFNSGASVQLTFANGTVILSPQMATTSKNFTGVVDGKSFFQKFCTGTSATHVATKKRDVSAPTSQSPFVPVWNPTEQQGPAHYPKPLVAAPSNAISGFVNLKQPELAVLAVPTFETEHWVEFQNTIRELLATAKGLGKTRLIIDLRGNTGGRVPLGLDFFSQLFPDMYAYNGNNFRAHDLFNRMGKIITDHFASIDAEEAQRSGASRNASIYTNLNAAVGLNQAGKNFASWEDFYGPNQVHGGSFTNIERWNLSDSAQMTGPFNWNVSNHGGNLVKINKGITVFDPKNILLIHDGFCGSTCADFAELMKAQAGVRSIAFGGRKQTGPMQGVGNVKGASVWPMNFIGTLITEAFSFATPDVANQLDATYGKSLAALEHTLSRAGIKGTSDVQAKVNTRNNIRRNDTSLTPLHFVYEAADCRLFYTAESLSDQSVVWTAAYDAMWGSAACVSGSRDHPSVEIVNGAALQAKFPAGADNTFGARYPPVPQPETANTAGNSRGKANAASRDTVLSPITVVIAVAIGLAPLVCQMW